MSTRESLIYFLGGMAIMISVLIFKKNEGRDMVQKSKTEDLSAIQDFSIEPFQSENTFTVAKNLSSYKTWKMQRLAVIRNDGRVFSVISPEKWFFAEGDTVKLTKVEYNINSDWRTQVIFINHPETNGIIHPPPEFLKKLDSGK